MNQLKIVYVVRTALCWGISPSYPRLLWLFTWRPYQFLWAEERLTTTPVLPDFPPFIFDIIFSTWKSKSFRPFLTPHIQMHARTSTHTLMLNTTLYSALFFPVRMIDSRQAPASHDIIWNPASTPPSPSCDSRVHMQCSKTTNDTVFSPSPVPHMTPCSPAPKRRKRRSTKFGQQGFILFLFILRIHFLRLFCQPKLPLRSCLWHPPLM